LIQLSLYGVSKLLVIFNPTLHIFDILDILIQGSLSSFGINLNISYDLYEMIVVKSAGLFVLASAIILKFKLFNHSNNMKI
jgi:uncharacterized membrane protein